MANIITKIDEFFLAEHNLNIFRISRCNTATLLWTSQQDALSYLRDLQSDEGSTIIRESARRHLH